MGRVRDPLVGRDILIGALFGIGVSLARQGSRIAPSWFGAAPQVPHEGASGILISGAHLAAALVAPWFVFIALWHLFIFFALRVFLRRQWAAILFYVVSLAVLFTFEDTTDLRGATLAATLLGQALSLVLTVIVLLRFGFLAFVVSMLFSLRLNLIPITLDFSAWYGAGSAVAMLTLLAVGGFGFHTALAGRSLFKDELFEG